MFPVHRFFILLLSSIVIFCLGACTTDAPDDVLSQSEMEEVLYDYHQALAIEGTDGVPSQLKMDEQTARNYYVQAVYKKHGLTEKDFNRSLQWYTRHSEILFKIYKNLDQRLRESGSLGSSNNIAISNATGDTLNIWRGVENVLLSSTGVNHFSFTQKADTALRQGDRLVLSYNSHWLYREGSKTAVAQIAIRYSNDSVATTTQYFYNAGYQNFIIRIGSSHSIKSVTGFVYQIADWSERPKLLVLSDISLLRIRDRQDVSIETRQETLQLTDSIRTPQTREQRLRDSIIVTENADKRRSHFEPIDITNEKKRTDERN